MSFLYKKRIIHILTVLTAAYAAYYIFWRAAYTLNTDALVFSIVLLAAEVQGAVNFLLFAMMAWNTQEDKTPPTMCGVSVDVFVPTYNEDIKILEATLVGCMRMRMPHMTYVLDDGRRDDVKALAQRMKCGYLTRADNMHAKAGNINAALKMTSGTFIVILDADMVPQPDFLEKTLGYFRDERTAIVQMPQEFYNFDSMQHNRTTAHWHEQQLFFHVIQPGKDKIGAAFWCGSPSIVRRAAILNIGGVATDSVTEDFLTSIRLNAKDWRIRYHHEVLAFGIAPQSFHAFSIQRLRWAQGSIKILRSRDNPLIKKGLTLKQRLSHFAVIFTYFDAYQKLIFLLTPVILLLSGLMPVRTIGGFDFVIHWLPYFMLMILASTALGRGYFQYVEVEKFNTLKMVTFIKASFSLLLPKKRDKFCVTPKTVEASVKKKDRRELLIQAILLAVIIVSVLFAAANTIWHLSVPYVSTAALGIALIWSVVNGVVLFVAMREVLSRLYMRQDYRFDIPLDGSIESADGHKHSARISNISRGGLSLSFTGEGSIESTTRIGTHAIVDIGLPDGKLSVPGQVVYDRRSVDGKHYIGFKFGTISTDARMRLYHFLFVTAPRHIYSKSGQRPQNNGELAKTPQKKHKELV